MATLRVGPVLWPAMSGLGLCRLKYSRSHVKSPINATYAKQPRSPPDMAQHVLSSLQGARGRPLRQSEKRFIRHFRGHLTMSLMTRKTRIDAKRVAQIIGCSRKTVLNGGAGTAQLTRIRNGSKQVRFILEEVQALVQKQETQAQRHRLTSNFAQEIDGQVQTTPL